ncbi:hypothetical protein Gbem_4125 [Citrifermentans bemidjiense Bem]|uniref:Uncharacterized protein n=1 Tax=Citrifermentans bemidjiense (strain ATCC BAA-1014 / DSM 16622 / JCM 12645 / Bem) TaxID=404380 RepID=E1P6C7_CITBB|nr:hypothetical protein Gbem_4125 [Citrifermentans bemidjiense Bem]
MVLDMYCSFLATVRQTERHSTSSKVAHCYHTTVAKSEPVGHLTIAKNELGNIL